MHVIILLSQTLVSKKLNPDEDPNDYNYWRASLYVHGSPGADDVTSDINDLFAESGKPDIYLNLYPNPVGTEVMISYRHEYSDVIRIELTDINGRLITGFSDKIIPGERYNRLLYVHDLNIPAGVYLVRLISGNDIAVKKLIISKASSY